MRVNHAKMTLVVIDHTQEDINRLLSCLESGKFPFAFELLGEDGEVARLEISFGKDEIASLGANAINEAIGRVIKLIANPKSPKPRTRTPYERQRDFEKKLNTHYGLPPE